MSLFCAWVMWSNNGQAISLINSFERAADCKERAFQMNEQYTGQRVSFFCAPDTIDPRTK
jgi:hypothetical protein